MMRAVTLILATSLIAACGDDATDATPDAVDAGRLDTSADAPDAVTDATAASDTDAADASAPPADYTAPGPWGVGTTSLSFEREGRTWSARVWYPAPADAGPVVADLAELAFDAEQSGLLSGLLADAPQGCPGSPRASVVDAAAASDVPRPLVIYSHCHECLAISGMHLAERLASHGVVVAAPEHAGNTLYDALADTGLPLDASTLAVREADATQLLDALLASDSPLNGRVTVDAERVAVAGHSFGAVTAGRLLQDHPAPIAGMAFAAPMENPLLPGVTVAELDDPALFVVAVEDNSITEFGNTLLRDNAAAAPAGSWRVEVADAGHWSFSDLCGLVDAFAPGCGEGMRQTAPGEAFSYLDAQEGRGLAASLGMAFAAEHLLDDEGAMARTVEGLDVEAVGPNP